jgi:Spy/CpxP family protein refolding chaperone
MTTHKLNMKNRVPIITSCLIGAGLLAVAAFVSVEQKTFAAEPQTDPGHAAHVAAAANQAGGQTIEAQLAEMLARIEQLEAITQQRPGQPPGGGAMAMGAGNPPRSRPMPGMGSSANSMQGGMASMSGMGAGNPPSGNAPGAMKPAGRMGGMGDGPAVADQLADLRAKMQRLEATIQQQSGSASAERPMSGMPGMGAGAKPMQGRMAAMSGMGAGNPPSGGAPAAMKPAGGMGGMGGMGASASPPSGEMGMMGMMTERMMGMMEKMMGGMGGMGGGARPAAAPMGGSAPGGSMGGVMMSMDKMEMGGMGGSTPATGAPMGGAAPGAGMGMMDMDKMETAGMMGMMGGTGGKGGSSMAMPSALPGFPGASHLYHVGATGFFLDHPECIELSTEQQMKLNQIKEQAALNKASASRSVQEAEQDLWTLTATDQPDNAQIEAKVAEIEKLRGDARLRFIRTIGDAAKILNDEQRKSLTGFAPPVSAPPVAGPAAAPAAAAAPMPMKDM